MLRHIQCTYLPPSAMSPVSGRRSAACTTSREQWQVLPASPASMTSGTCAVNVAEMCIENNLGVAIPRPVAAAGTDNRNRDRVNAVAVRDSEACIVFIHWLPMSSVPRLLFLPSLRPYLHRLNVLYESPTNTRWRHTQPVVKNRGSPKFPKTEFLYIHLISTHGPRASQGMRDHGVSLRPIHWTARLDTC